MPTLNPRINVTLSPSSDTLVQRLSSLQGVSKAQVLRELLEAAEPALHRAVALMEAASGAQRAVLDGLSASLEKAQARAEVAYRRTLSEADSMTADLVSQAQAVRGRNPARAAFPARVTRSAARAGGAGVGARAGAPNPPASNRGVKSTKSGKRSSNDGVKK